MLFFYLSISYFQSFWGILETGTVIVSQYDFPIRGGKNKSKFAGQCIDDSRLEKYILTPSRAGASNNQNHPPSCHIFSVEKPHSDSCAVWLLS
jgi:hypothetical protein